MIEILRTALLRVFEQSNLPYTFDIVLYDHQANEVLRGVIDREGKLLFCVDAGRIIMTVERIRPKAEDYHRVLLRLQTALKRSRSG